MMVAGVVTLSLCLIQAGAFFFPNHQCYESYGCFNNMRPYTNAKGFVPLSPSDQRVRFLLFTPHNPNLEEQVKDGDLAKVKASKFNPKHNTKIIIHGMFHHGDRDWIREMRNALLAKEDCNVIVVDWENGARIYWYSFYDQASANTRVAGAVIAELVKTLVKVGASLSKIHLIGHSLGAHAAGYAGERLPGLGRITGLDPAGPNFENENHRVRLDPTDAVFVDVIHSDLGNIRNLEMGLKAPAGHVDFYPAGGYNQPGCAHTVADHLNNLHDIVNSVACSRERAIDYFTVSISGTCTFKAYPCSTSMEDMKMCSTNSCVSGCSSMGYYANPRPAGTFYVKVTDTYPYCCRFLDATDLSQSNIPFCTK